MSSNEEDKRIFATIRPYCVTLSRLALAPVGVFDPNSTEIINALRDVYINFKESITTETVLSANLADYVFVPLSYLLKQPKLGDSQITYLLKILTLIIRHCWTQKSSIPYVLARQLFPLVTFLTGGSPNPKDNTEINLKSSELRASGAETLDELFKSLVNQKKGKLYDFFGNVENLPALGHCVTILLELSLNGESIELQLQSLAALDTLYFNLIDDGEILSYILPGNVSTLTKIISSNDAHYTVIVQSLKVMKKLLVLVYNDEELKLDFKELENIEEINTDDFQMEHIILKDTTFQKVHRTQSWLKGTSNQVKLALENVKKVQFHSKFEVQENLLELAQSLLRSCLYSLNLSTPILIEIIAHLSKDSRLKTETNQLFPADDLKHKEIFKRAVSTELNIRVDSFSSVIQSPNESKILSTISALKFSFQHSSNDFLASKLIESTFIELTDLLNKSTKHAKLISTTYDLTTSMLITNELSSLELESKPLTVYDNVLTKDVQLELSDLFQTLGEHRGDISELVENLLAKENTTNIDKGVIVWIASNLVQGYVNKVKPTLITNEFLHFDEDDELEVYQTPEFVYSLLEYSKLVLDEVSEQDPSETIVQVNSIALDSIGVVANFMRQDFKEELVDYLYPVIDSLVSPSEVVRQHALSTSMIIADNLYSGSLYNLILDNSDYLVDAISIRLSSAMTTRTTAILAVCVKIAGFKIIESFKDVMEIIFNLLDFYHGYADICIGFFVLFEILTDEIRKKYLYDKDLSKIEYPDNTSSFAPWGMENVDQLLHLLDKSNKDILIEPPETIEEEDIEEVNKDSDDEDDEDVPEEQPEEKEEWLSPVPKDAYQLLQQIVYYGERLLTHPSAKLHVQIMKTYIKALPIFATQITNLYPIASSMWPIVSHLVTSSDPKVAIPAAKVVSQLIEYTTTFLSKRFVELWAKLKTNNLLVSCSKEIISSRKQVILPGLNSKYFESLVDMLTVAITRLGRSIPDYDIEEVIAICIGVIPDFERFGIHQDTAWILKGELFEFEQLQPPKPILVGSKSFKFTQIPV